MIQFKKVIPTLAAATLALTGCGGTTDGTGGTGATGEAAGTGGTGGRGGIGGSGGTGDLANSLRRFCMTLVECYPTDYTVQECVDYYTAYVDEYREFFGPGCELALISYADCLSMLTCRELEADDVCDAELDALDECG